MAQSYDRRINLYINIDGKQVNNNVKSIRGEMTKLVNSQNQMTIGSKEYLAEGRKIQQLKGILNQHYQDVAKIGKSWSLKGMAENFNKYIGVVATGIASAVAAGMAFKKITDAADNFKERLDNLSALTGLEGSQLEWLGEKAMETSVKITEGGVAIKQSADDIVDAYTKVGSQRPELLRNKEALAAVTEDAIILSEAAKSDLEPAVKGLTTTLNQFNLPAEDSRRIINALAAGSKEGAGDISYLTDAIEKSGTTMRLMNISVEENIGLIESIAPNYAEASMAGNSLDKVFMKMKAKNIGYVNGTFNLNAALDELEKRYKNGQSAADLFGVEHAKMGELLVLNRKDISRYTDAVTGTNIAIEQARKNTSNNAAVLAQATNEYHNAAIELGKNLSPAMTIAYKAAGSLASAFSRMITDSPAKVLENEGLLVNTLATELTNSNTPLNRRKEILDELKGISPDIVTGLEAENLNYTTLKTNLQSYNTELSNRIVLENLSEDEKKYASKVAKYKQQFAELQVDILGVISKTDQGIALSNTTLDEKTVKTLELLRKRAGNVIKAVTGAAAYGNNEDLKALLQFQALLELSTNAQNNLNESQGKETDFSARAKAMREILGIQEQINTPPPQGGGGGGNTSLKSKDQLKEDAAKAIAILDEANNERMARLVIQYEKEGWTDEKFKAQQLSAELSYLTLKKALLDQFGQSTIQTEAQISQKRIEMQKSINSALSDSDNELYKEIEATRKLDEEAIKNSMNAADKVLVKIKKNKEDEKQILEERQQVYLQFAIAVGQSFGDLMMNQEATFGDYLKNTILMALDAFHQWFIIAKAEEIIKGIKGGPIGIAVAIAKVAAMEIAYQGVRSVVANSGKKTPKYASGGYTNGEGVYIAGENGKEWIAPSYFLTNPLTSPIIAGLEEMRRNPIVLTSGAIMTSKSFKPSSSIPILSNPQTNIKNLSQNETQGIDIAELNKAINLNSKAIALLLKDGVRLDIVTIKRHLDIYSDILDNTGMGGFKK